MVKCVGHGYPPFPGFLMNPHAEVVGGLWASLTLKPYQHLISAVAFSENPPLAAFLGISFGRICVLHPGDELHRLQCQRDSTLLALDMVV